MQGCCSPAGDIPSRVACRLETFEFQAAHASLLVSSTSPGSMEKSTWEPMRHAIRSLSGFSALGLGPNLNEMMSRRRSHRQAQRFDKRPNLTKKGARLSPNIRSRDYAIAMSRRNIQRENRQDSIQISPLSPLEDLCRNTRCRPGLQTTSTQSTETMRSRFETR